MMICPECGWKPQWNWALVCYSRDDPCIACGFNMDGVEFYGGASSEFVEVGGDDEGIL